MFRTLWCSLRCFIAAEFSSFSVMSTVLDSHIGASSLVFVDSLRASTLKPYLRVSLSIAWMSLGSLLVFPEVPFHVCHRTEDFLGSSGLLLEIRMSSFTTSAHRGMSSWGAHHFFAVTSRAALVLSLKLGRSRPPKVLGISTTSRVVSPLFFPAHITRCVALVILSTTEGGGSFVIIRYCALDWIIKLETITLPRRVMRLLDHLSARVSIFEVMGSQI